MKISEALSSSSIKVVINKEKPGKGNFVVSVAGISQPIIELRGMKRPFPPLKALAMDQVIKNIQEALSR
jgi:hypothetical protein